MLDDKWWRHKTFIHFSHRNVYSPISMLRMMMCLLFLFFLSFLPSAAVFGWRDELSNGRMMRQGEVVSSRFYVH